MREKKEADRAYRALWVSPMAMALMCGGTLLDNEHGLEPFDPRVIAMIGKHGGWFAAE